MEATTTAEIGDICSMVVTWHEKRIATLESIVKADSSSIVLEVGGKKVELTGDLKKGFIAGIQVAIEQFSPFPLKVEKLVDADDEWEREDEAEEHF